MADQIRHIATARHPIPDVPVLYLVEPLPANLMAITSDLSRGLYSPAYINFLSSIPRPLLEDFAAQTAAAGTSESIAQVFDQYLNFIVGEPDLFSLGMRKESTYWALNSARTKDEELDHVVDKVVSGLFSVVVTMGSSHIDLAIFVRELILKRCYPDYTMSKRSRCGDGICQARSQTSRPHPKLQRQPILRHRSSASILSRRCFFKTSTNHIGSQCGSYSHVIALMDLSVTRS